jgi:hypothetical protein
MSATEKAKSGLSRFIPDSNDLRQLTKQEGETWTQWFVGSGTFLGEVASAGVLLSMIVGLVIPGVLDTVLNFKLADLGIGLGAIPLWGSTPLVPTLIWTGIGFFALTMVFASTLSSEREDVVDNTTRSVWYLVGALVVLQVYGMENQVFNTAALTLVFIGVLSFIGRMLEQTAEAR